MFCGPIWLFARLRCRDNTGEQKSCLRWLFATPLLAATGAERGAARVVLAGRKVGVRSAGGGLLVVPKHVGGSLDQDVLRSNAAMQPGLKIDDDW